MNVASTIHVIINREYCRTRGACTVVTMTEKVATTTKQKRFGTALPPLELLTEHTARELLLLALRLLAQLRGARSQSVLDCQEPESRTAKGHVPGLGTLGEAGGAARLEIPAARGRMALKLLRRA